MALAANSRLGPYEIVTLIGSGAMGEVYRARDTQLDRDVAIKLISPAEAGDDAYRRFEAEARAVSALNHPNIVQMYTYYLRPVLIGDVSLKHQQQNNAEGEGSR